MDQLKTQETGRFAVVNAFYEYYNTAKAVKEVNGGLIYNIMHGPDRRNPDGIATISPLPERTRIRG